jgi:penicillin amidase
MPKAFWFLFFPLTLGVLLYFLLRERGLVVLTKGCERPVRIVRNEWGIPHIYAENLPDAYYALGYAMTQDRMWQIDMMRRLATGRLSEVFGNKTVEIDKFIRNIKIPIASRDDINNLDSETLKIGQKFVDGINDAASEGHSLEYWMTSSQWNNFTLSDSQAILYFTALYLSMFSGTDSVKQQFKSLGLDPEILLPSSLELNKSESFSVSNEELPEALKGKKLDILESEFKEFVNFYTQLFEEGAGSNAWIIGGNHTKSGKPVLSNDPHLSASIPSTWYLAHIFTPEVSVYGSCAIGSPILTIGRTKDLTWGVTAIKSDDLDFYVEKLENSSHYYFGEELFEFLTFEEIIEIKGQEPIFLKFKESVHGPILENTFIGLKRFIPSFACPESQFFSFAWASLGFNDKSLSLTHKLLNVKNVQDLRKAVSTITAIRLSMLAGSSNGDILLQTTGKLPVRRYKGDMFLPGWNTKTIWKGFIPFDDMPYVINPSKGFIVTANNYITGPEYKYFNSLGSTFSQGRIERITEIIASKIKEGHKFTAEDQLIILKDEKDLFAERMIPSLLNKIYLRLQGKYKEKAEMLMKWDFYLKRESNLAAIYAKWNIELAKILVKNHVPEAISQSFLRSSLLHTSISNYFREGFPPLDDYCDDKKTQKIESCEDLIEESFKIAVNDVGEQTWGELHLAVLQHFPFSQTFFKSFFERKMSVGGWTGTIHATSSNWNSTFEVVHGPGLKFVCDLGNSSSNYWSLESGISGNVFSKHYSDMFQEFHYGNIPRFEFVG